MLSNIWHIDVVNGSAINIGSMHGLIQRPFDALVYKHSGKVEE